MPPPYDALALDAFSGDAIPVHLLTKQALDLYLKHLKPDGDSGLPRLKPIPGSGARDSPACGRSWVSSSPGERPGQRRRAGLTDGLGTCYEETAQY